MDTGKLPNHARKYCLVYVIVFLWRVFFLFLFLTCWEFRINSQQFGLSTSCFSFVFCFPNKTMFYPDALLYPLHYSPTSQILQKRTLMWRSIQLIRLKARISVAKGYQIMLAKLFLFHPYYTSLHQWATEYYALRHKPSLFQALLMTRKIIFEPLN